MARVKNKRVLKKIANEWAAGILLCTGMDSFDENDLTIEEQGFVVEEVHRIARKLHGNPMSMLTNIIDQYYEYPPHSNGDK